MVCVCVCAKTHRTCAGEPPAACLVKVDPCHGELAHDVRLVVDSSVVKECVSLVVNSAQV